MPKADFNQEFPTRASLRRAREEQEAERKTAQALKGAAAKNAEPDVFDAVPESDRPQTQNPSAAQTPKPGMPTSKAAETAKPAITSSNAPIKKPASDATSATVGAGKAPAPNKTAEAKQPATAKPPVVKPASPKPQPVKPTSAKPVAAATPKLEAKQQASTKTAPEAAAKPVAAKPATAKSPVAQEATKATPVVSKPAANKPAPAKPAEASKKPAATANPAVAPAVKPAVPTKSAHVKPASAAKGTEKPAAAAKPAVQEPAKTNTAPASEGVAAQEAADLSLSTAEGRRQAFRELNPSAGERDTFLRPEDETSFRAERGFRGFLSRMGFAMEPSAQEVEERSWRRTVGTRLNEPKTISVVNGKGGANKTPTAVLLSAVFGRNSGDPVLVWDNNGTRGTLGWRTLKGSHTHHSMDLLAAAEKLKETRVGDPAINDYVHYQPEDCYSVLRTDPTLLASEQHVNAADFDVLHEIVSRFFSLTIVDSGNDESAERWLRMIDHTDQLVIASTTVEEHAEAGALLLEALAKRGGRYEELAKNAVVIISQHQPQGNDEQLNRIAHGFRRLARQVVTVPYDAALVKGQIRFDGLRPATRRAWLHATAAVAGALHN